MTASVRRIIAVGFLAACDRSGTTRSPDPGACVRVGEAAVCNFEHAGCCYERQDQACAAAGCEPDACTIAGGMPAQPVCT